MTITKKQFQTFKRHFKIMEITRATVETTADLDFENFKEYHDEPDNFFLETNWVRYPAEVTSSEGYHIQYIPLTISLKPSVISTTWPILLKMIWKTIWQTELRKANP